jgi:hypothetical protein
MRSAVLEVTSTSGCIRDGSDGSYLRHAAGFLVLQLTNAIPPSCQGDIVLSEFGYGTDRS